MERVELYNGCPQNSQLCTKNEVKATKLRKYEKSYRMVVHKQSIKHQLTQNGLKATKFSKYEEQPKHSLSTLILAPFLSRAIRKHGLYLLQGQAKSLLGNWHRWNGHRSIVHIENYIAEWRASRVKTRYTYLSGRCWFRCRGCTTSRCGHHGWLRCMLSMRHAHTLIVVGLNLAVDSNCCNASCLL